MVPTETSPALEREGLRFFGRIAAGLSHELSNVFNIINELAGLEQDIARGAAETSSGAATERIADLAGRIKAQVGRAETLNRRLHGFAHTIDNATVVFDLSDVLDLLGALAARAARLGRVELDLRRPPAPITLEGDPFALLLALYAMVEIGIAGATSERRLVVAAEPAGSGARVTLSSADPLPPLGEDAGTGVALELGRAVWGASLSRERVDAADGIVLTLPAIAPAARPTSGDSPREDSNET